MEELLNMYNDLDMWMRVYWGCAIVSSFFFIIQMILTLIGMDSSDLDVDFDGADTMDLGGGLSLFSARSLVNFFCGAGWAGVCLNGVISNKFLLMVVSLLVGCAFVYMFFIIKRQTKKLEHNGAYELSDCIGKTTSVYLRIPANGNGIGKVQVSINGSVQEIDAITYGADEFPTGCKVKVTDVVDDHTLLVGRLD